MRSDAEQQIREMVERETRAWNEKDAGALQWLERGMIDHSGTLNCITWPPWFDAINSDPRCAPILRRMGLRKYDSGTPATPPYV